MKKIFFALLIFAMTVCAISMTQTAQAKTKLKIKDMDWQTALSLEDHITDYPSFGIRNKYGWIPKYKIEFRLFGPKSSKKPLYKLVQKCADDEFCYVDLSSDFPTYNLANGKYCISGTVQGYEIGGSKNRDCFIIRDGDLFYVR